MHLTGPPDPDLDVGYGWENPRAYLDALSPTYWINEVIKSTVGWDPIGKAAAVFTGDWEAFARFGSALGQLAAFSDALGVKIQRGANTADQDWDGNAADAAYMYFSHLATNTVSQRILLTDLQQQYYGATAGVWTAARGVGSAIGMATDAAIIAGVSAAAGTIMVKTVVAPIVGYAIAAWQVARIVDAVGDIVKWLDIAAAGIDTVAGTTQSLLNRPSDLERYPLPESSYDHPAVSAP